ncbi:unnamed protein product [Paramecium octaurelia]|uniref:Uncharacterized protein n=1 Tax=Paramecium octaurelia TaxID=43137 RepID=A0A8S1YPG7_PAROT|nr:unnamed protein product [Paramecium octaurelia]
MQIQQKVFLNAIILLKCDYYRNFLVIIHKSNLEAFDLRKSRIAVFITKVGNNQENRNQLNPKQSLSNQGQNVARKGAIAINIPAFLNNYFNPYIQGLCPKMKCLKDHIILIEKTVSPSSIRRMLQSLVQQLNTNEKRGQISFLITMTYNYYVKNLSFNLQEMDQRYKLIQFLFWIRIKNEFLKCQGRFPETQNQILLLETGIINNGKFILKLMRRAQERHHKFNYNNISYRTQQNNSSTYSLQPFDAINNILYRCNPRNFKKFSCNQKKVNDQEITQAKMKQKLDFTLLLNDKFLQLETKVKWSIK